MDTCYKLHDYPKESRNCEKGKGILVNQVSEEEGNESGDAGNCNMITQEQYAQLMSLLQQNTATTNMVQSRASLNTDNKMHGCLRPYCTPNLYTENVVDVASTVGLLDGEKVQVVSVGSSDVEDDWTGVPSLAIQNKTLFEKLYRKKPAYAHMKVFGCLAFASTLTNQRHKFDSRARRCVFLGYPLGTKGYKLLDVENEEEEEEEPLSPAARLFHEPNFNVHIIAIMGCKTVIYPDVVKANLLFTLLKHPRFSSLQVADEKKRGEMKWVRTEVDLEKHVIVPHLDSAMDAPDKFLEDYVYNLTTTVIPNSQPLWDLHLLNLKTSHSQAIAIFRIHHSLGDGTSLMSLLLACTRQMQNPQALPTIPTSKQRQKTGNNSKSFWVSFFVLWSFLKLLCNTIIDVFMFVATALFLKDTENPLKGPPGVESRPRRIVFRTISLDDFKLIKNAMNTTINDVAVGITQAGLSRYLNRIYGEGRKDGGETEKKNNLPKKIRLRSTLLVNIRASTGIQALADMMEKNTEAKWGNWIGFILLPFDIAIRDDPLDYVRQAKATVDRKKRSLEAIYTFSISELVLKLFGIKVASALSHKIISNTTMCLSNLVGPLEEIGFYGHPMAFLAPSSYGQPHALMINFQSYVNKMSIVLSADEGTVHNPHQLCDDIMDSLKLIKNAAIARNNQAMLM
ncbi:O-acyltransferase WSD1-like [Carica papaya]|uniref:O-acyltransferase WSD1-like n=1 Tax=Carica papaya TaxID=3649 RepID=UPI000B8C9F51|nr:O-acyltransferase WSD1-like [Carica papaya]